MWSIWFRILWFVRKDGSLCTLTCSSTRMYSPNLGRCMSPTEALLAQGFPATPWASRAMGCSHRKLSETSDNAMFKLAGNAMHAACVGCVLAWILGYIELEATTASDHCTAKIWSATSASEVFLEKSLAPWRSFLRTVLKATPSLRDQQMGCLQCHRHSLHALVQPADRQMGRLEFHRLALHVLMIIRHPLRRPSFQNTFGGLCWLSLAPRSTSVPSWRAVYFSTRHRVQREPGSCCIFPV